MPLPALRSPPALSQGGTARAATIATTEAEVDAGSTVFTFKEGDGTVDKKPAFPRGKGSQVVGSPSAGHWTLPLCWMTVQLQDHAWFWDDVRAKTDTMGGCGLARRPLQGRDGFPSSAGAVRQALASVPMEPTGWDLEDDDASSSGLQAFPVI